MNALFDPLFLRALLAGLCAAAMTGPLGCFVVWRRLAYFGDAVAHAALLGVAGGLLLHAGTGPGVVAVALGMAMLLAALQGERRLASDALLGVLSHGALALALVIIALAGVRVDVQAYLFGDILAATPQDILFIALVAAGVLAALCWQWRNLLFLAASEDIARVEGVPAAKLNRLLMALIALAVAASIQVVGMLLITALLIIPAASARHFALSPGGMARGATFLGMLAVATGLAAAFMADTPAGPSIILAAIVFFAVARALKR